MYFYWERFFYFLVIVEGIIIYIFCVFSCYFSSMYFSFEIVFLFFSIIVIERAFGIVLVIVIIFYNFDYKRFSFYIF